MPAAPSSTQPAQLPQGTWTVDHERSTLGFESRGMFGLAKVTGQFTRYEGELTVDGSNAHGEL